MQPVDQRDDVRLAHGGVSDRDVYLHTLPMFHCNGWGMPFALAGLGAPAATCCARSTGRRSCAAIGGARGHLDVRRAGRVSTRSSAAAQQWQGGGPGRGKGPRGVWPGRRRRPRTIERVEAELGWEFLQIYGLTETSPLLTINRTREGDGLTPRR